MDTDPQPDPSPDTEPSDDGTVADAAPAEDEAVGAAPTDDEPAASDAYGNPDDHVGDFTTPDVDLSHLTPASDGEPDDEEAPAADQADTDTSPQVSTEETVEQNATGQAVVWDDSDPGLPVTPTATAQDDEPTEPTA